MSADWTKVEWPEWQSFSRSGVKTHAPDAPGVYALRTDASGPLAYIGRAASIAQRLRQHIAGDLTGTKRGTSRAIHFEYSFIIIEGDAKTRARKELEVLTSHLAEFGIPPIFNRVLGFDPGEATEPVVARRAGLLGPDGRPLSSRDRKLAVEQVGFVQRELIAWISKKPDRLFTLDPRVFEQVVAELFSKQGYEVTLTPQTRDGGKDIIAIKRDTFAKFLCIVECKRYAPHKPVDVSIIRSLYGVQNLQRATLSMVATTSSFTKDAREEHKVIEHQMALREYKDILRWISEYLET